MNFITFIRYITLFVSWSIFINFTESYRVSGRIYTSFDQRVNIQGANLVFNAYSVNTLSDGTYSIDLPAGSYDVNVTYPGKWYAPAVLNITTYDVPGYDFALLDRQTGLNFEFLVLWGSKPQDLEAFLFTPFGCNTSRLNTGGCQYNGAVGKFGYDDNDGWGPESIILNNAVPGTYEFWVYLQSVNPEYFVQSGNFKDPIVYMSSSLGDSVDSRRIITTEKDATKKWWRAISLVVDNSGSFTFDFPNQILADTSAYQGTLSATTTTTTTTTTTSSTTSSSSSTTSSSTSSPSTSAASSSSSPSTTSAVTSASTQESTTSSQLPSATSGARTSSVAGTGVSATSAASSSSLSTGLDGNTGIGGNSGSGGQESVSGESAAAGSIGAIVGGIIGGFALLIVFIFVALYFRRKYRKRNQDAFNASSGFKSDFDRVVPPNIEKGTPVAGDFYNQGRAPVNQPPPRSTSAASVQSDYALMDVLGRPATSPVPPTYMSHEYAPPYPYSSQRS